MPTRLNEFAILIVGRQWRSQVEWYSHGPIALRAGLSQKVIDELRQNYCIVIVTHSMQQAARVSQRTAFFHLGKIVEYGKTSDIFTNPREERTKDYITGRFG